MPGEMRAALNKFYYFASLQDKETKLPQKLWAFLEKNNGLLFFRFDDCGPFEKGPGTNVSNAFLLNTTSLGYSC